MEEKLKVQELVQEKSNRIIESKKRLGKLKYAIAISEVKKADSTSLNNIELLKSNVVKIQEEIKANVGQLYAFQNSIEGVSFSEGSVTFNPGTAFPANGITEFSDWEVEGTANPVQYTYRLYWQADGLNYQVTKPDGTTISAPDSGFVSVSGAAGTTSSISISATASSGYALYGSPSAGASVTHSSSNNGGNNQSSPATLNPQAYVIFNMINATGPYIQYSDAANCISYPATCAGGLSVYYLGGSEGVLGSSPYYTTWSAAAGPSGALESGRYYTDQDAEPNAIFYN